MASGLAPRQAGLLEPGHDLLQVAGGHGGCPGGLGRILRTLSEWIQR
jgi:hypothetical protein